MAIVLLLLLVSGSGFWDFRAWPGGCPSSPRRWGFFRGQNLVSFRTLPEEQVAALRQRCRENNVTVPLWLSQMGGRDWRQSMLGDQSKRFLHLEMRIFLNLNLSTKQETQHYTTNTKTIQKHHPKPRRAGVFGHVNFDSKEEILWTSLLKKKTKPNKQTERNKQNKSI